MLAQIVRLVAATVWKLDASCTAENVYMFCSKLYTWRRVAEIQATVLRFVEEFSFFKRLKVNCQVSTFLTR